MLFVLTGFSYSFDPLFLLIFLFILVAVVAFHYFRSCSFSSRRSALVLFAWSDLILLLPITSFVKTPKVENSRHICPSQNLQEKMQNNTEKGTEIAEQVSEKVLFLFSFKRISVCLPFHNSLILGFLKSGVLANRIRRKEEKEMIVIFVIIEQARIL